jgi:hypothetical protein
MTERLRVEWPDPALFAARHGAPYRILAVSDAVDESLEAQASRERLGGVDLVAGCGDLEADYLAFLADAFCAPLAYVRGNHDIGAAWDDAVCERKMIPPALPDGRVRDEAGLRIVGFSGSPTYNEDRAYQRSDLAMWTKTLWLLAREHPRGPLLVLSHAAPRGANDGDDYAHRGFGAFRWLAERLHPPLWLHGHTTLLRRALDARSVRLGPTLVYNCTGATLVELVPSAPAGAGASGPD